jgi:hypothetical protein
MPWEVEPPPCEPGARFFLPPVTVASPTKRSPPKKWDRSGTADREALLLLTWDGACVFMGEDAPAKDGASGSLTTLPRARTVRLRCYGSACGRPSPLKWVAQSSSLNCSLPASVCAFCGDCREGLVWWDVARNPRLRAPAAWFFGDAAQY